MSSIFTSSAVSNAVEHLGVNLVLVLGHDHCGAVDAAMHHSPDGHIQFITSEISEAIGTEQDALQACKKNVMHSIRQIRDDRDMQKLIQKCNVTVAGAIYHLESGIVELM